jgi:uncharacterized membrane protein (DUF2068 family)
MPTSERHAALRVIAAYKFLKVIFLLLMAAAAFGLVREARFEAFTAWVEQLPIHHGHGFLVQIIDRFLELGPRKFLAIGIAACIYASVFAVEGWGLWREKRWAEYLTTIVTASLIPIEVWEIIRNVTWLKVITLVANAAIVVYLIYLLRRPQTPGALGGSAKSRSRSR